MKTSLRQKMTSTFTKFYPFYSGCGSFANSKLVYFLGGTQGGNTWSRVTGGDVFADLSDYVGRSAYFVGDLDRKITWVCKQIVREGDTVLDIGANIGMVTVLLSDLVGSNGTVHSFEPNPQLSDQLYKTIAHNKLSNVTIHPIGLGLRKEILELAVPAGNRGAASLIRGEELKNTQSINVNIDRLDEIVQNEELTNIRLVKIDVEGFEESVFLGAHNLLSKIRPDAILFELNERTEEQFSAEPLVKLLDSYGYDFIAIPKNIIRMQLLKVSALSEEVNLGHDFLAAPKGRQFDEIANLVNACT